MPTCPSCGVAVNSVAHLEQHAPHCPGPRGARGAPSLLAQPSESASGLSAPFTGAFQPFSGFSGDGATRSFGHVAHPNRAGENAPETLGASAASAAECAGQPGGAGRVGLTADAGSGRLPALLPVSSEAGSDGDDEPGDFNAALVELLDELHADDAVTPTEPVPCVSPDGPAGYRSRPTFDEFRAIVLRFLEESGPATRAELLLLQLARRRDMSGGTCDAQIKLLTNPAFVSSAYGSGATVQIRTSWRSVMNSARELLRRLRAFLPHVHTRTCEVRTGPGKEAHVHSGRVTYSVGSATWAFMLLDAQLYAPTGLVRPVASAGQSARLTLHDSWLDHVDGAPHPSFAPLTKAREATICAALADVAARMRLRVVPFGLIVSCDGTDGANHAGRASMTALYARPAWLPFRRLHEERAYSILALAQFGKMPAAAGADAEVASVLRPALMQEMLRACLCCNEALEPFVSTFPGETEPVIVASYVAALSIDGGESIQICACGGGGKGCCKCLCPYALLGDPVTPGCCAGGGVFRDGARIAAWAAQHSAAGTTYDRVPKAEEVEHRAKPVVLAISEDVILRTLPSQATATAHGMSLPATLREYVIPKADIFHMLREGELPKTRQRFKTLMLNSHRAKGGRKKDIQAGYARSLDAVDRWGAAVPVYALPGSRTLTHYYPGWMTATAVFGWDHVNFLSHMPMTMGFCDVALPRRLRKRVTRAIEAVLEVDRLTFAHGKDARACEERRLATIRMFALQDLAFEPSRACPGGGYTAARGKYAKRHGLLAQTIFDADAGDPVYFSTDPFEMLHKILVRAGYRLSLKHASTVGRDILQKFLIDRVFSVLVPQALGWTLEPLAPLEDRPLSRKLGSRQRSSASPAELLGAIGYAHFTLAWDAARADGVAPDEPFDPTHAQIFANVTLSGGVCRSQSVVLRCGCACEVQWTGGADVWQAQPSNDDSDNDSEDEDAGASVFAGGAGPRGLGPGRRRVVSRSAAAPSRHRVAEAEADDDSGADFLDAPPSSRGTGTRGRPALLRRGLSRSTSRGGGVAASAAATAAGTSSSDELGSHAGPSEAGRGSRGRGRAGRRSRGRLPRHASQGVRYCSDSDEGSDGVSESAPFEFELNAAGAAGALPTARPRSGKRRRESPLSFSTEPGRSSSSSGSGRTVFHAGGDPSSSESDSGSAVDPSAAGHAAGVPATAGAARLRAAPLRPTRPELKAASSDHRLRRRLSCDPVVSLQLVFEYGKRRGGVGAAAAAAAPSALQLVFAYKYEAVPELDAFAELGSRDFTVRECAARGAVVMPVSSLVRPRRNVSVPADQLPPNWQGLAAAADGRPRAPEYIWFQ